MRDRPAVGDGVSSSIGIALFPLDADGPTTLSQNYADTALIAPSRKVAISIAISRPRWAPRPATAAGEHELRHAVSRGEFYLVYQPQKEIKSGKMVRLEALLRSRHPERCLLPWRVHTGCGGQRLILQIGDWVLRRPARKAAKLENPLAVAVNVSAVQLHNPTSLSWSTTLLVETGLLPRPPGTRDHRDRASPDLRGRCPRCGRSRRLASGWPWTISELAIPPFQPLVLSFHKIKVDSSFIKSVDTNDQSAAIVEPVLGLGRGLGLHGPRRRRRE